jgi:ribulose-5-phosphate 4-epimerase/fuculose-1-phosphate aldolase
MDSVLSELIDDLFIATRILVNELVIDGFGHVSVRSPNPTGRYFMTRDNSGEYAGENDTVELTLDSDPIKAGGPRPSIERFIHGEIYKARPDVNAIVHTHSPFMIPFGVSSTPLKPLYHMCGFLAEGAPVFDIQEKHGMTNMLITSNAIGESLATSLGKGALVLMRGHGATVVGSSVKEAVYRAIYATINAQLQPIAMQLGDPKFLALEEARKADELHGAVLHRPWEYWKKKL